MRFLPQIFAVLALIVCVSACPQASQGPSTQSSEPDAPAEGSVEFDIAPLKGAQDFEQWLATYTAEGKTAKFRIEFGAAKPQQGISFGKGRFVAQEGSDASALLHALKKALEAKNLPTHVQRAGELPFEYANLGAKMSRAPDGGLNVTPAGNWSAIKVFLANGEAEVFLNVNPIAGKAEFSIKDADYGDKVLAELAKVL